MADKIKSLCTDKHWWSYNDDEKHFRRFAQRISAGRMCKKAIMQVAEESKDHSSPDLACNAILFRALKELTKPERKAFMKAFEIGRGRYDKELGKKLMADPRFANNAKIILVLRNLDPGEGDGSGAAPTYEVRTKVVQAKGAPGNGKG